MNLKALTPYQKINLILFIFILSIFVYSGIFSYRGRYPFSSQTEMLFQKESISSGMSRSFSAIIRGEFQLARVYNRYGIQLFIFFSIQLILRSFFFTLSKKQVINPIQLIFADVGISTGLFVVYFEPFIKETIFFS